MSDDLATDPLWFAVLLRDWAEGRVHAGLLAPAERFHPGDLFPRPPEERAAFARWAGRAKPGAHRAPEPALHAA